MSGERKEHHGGAKRRLEFENPFESRSRRRLNERGDHFGPRAARRRRSARPIRSTVGSYGRVERTYESQEFAINNGAGQGEGVFYSFKCYWDIPTDAPILQICEGGPATGNVIAIGFAEWQQEMKNFAGVFRDVSISEIEMEITQAAGAVNTAGSAGTTPPPDIGMVVMIPWAGQPGMANYTTGAPTNAINPRDYLRYKNKVAFKAAADGGDMRKKILAFAPMSVEAIPEVADDSTLDQVKTVHTGSCDIERMRSGEENLNSYGCAWWWDHPELAGHGGYCQILLRFRIKFVWHGIREVTQFASSALLDPVCDGRLAQLLASGIPVRRTAGKPEDLHTIDDVYPQSSAEVSKQEAMADDIVLIKPPPSTPATPLTAALARVQLAPSIPSLLRR